MRTLRVFVATPDRLASVIGLLVLSLGCAVVWPPLGAIVGGGTLILLANLPGGQ